MDTVAPASLKRRSPASAFPGKDVLRPSGVLKSCACSRRLHLLVTWAQFLQPGFKSGQSPNRLFGQHFLASFEGRLSNNERSNDWRIEWTT
jgi:hypothetical protein